uniref:Uncharacterized protein n=1 Tax=Clastoptera arizonana TaxID=38151 RepID=A0A1B6E7K0_9HEMI
MGYVFLDEGLKPLFDRPELKANSDESSVDYQRSVIKSSKSCEKEVKEIKKERPSTSRDVSHSHPYSSKNKDQAHSPVYSRSRSSPPRGEFHDSYNGRRGTSREVEKRSRESFSERRIIYDRERTRDQPSTSYHHRHHDDRHYELEKRRSHRSPSSRERKKSTDSQNPSRERDYERRKQLSKRRRNHSSSQEDEGRTKQESETKPSPRRHRDEAENLPNQAVRPQYSSEFEHHETHDLIPVGPMRPIMPPPMHMDPYGPYHMMRGPPPMMGRIPPPRMFRPMAPPPRHMLPRPPFRMRGGFGPRKSTIHQRSSA